MLNHRSLALLLALLAAALAFFAGPTHLGHVIQWSAHVKTYLVVVLVLHIAGLMLFSLIPRRNDWHLAWLVPVTAVVAAKLVARFFAGLSSGHWISIMPALLFPALYLAVIFLSAYIVSENRRVGMVSLLSVVLSVTALVVQQHGWLAKIF